MKGDFSRKTFRRCKHYNGVLLQQGRTLSDADFNEQVAIQSHIRNTAHRDIIGQCGAPREGGGFEIIPTPDRADLAITPGRIYVDGVLCELDGEWVSCAVDDIDEGILLVETLILDCRQLEVGQYVEVLYGEETGDRMVAKVIDVLPERKIRCQFSATDLDILTDVGASSLRRVVTYLSQEDYPNPEVTLPDAFPQEDSYFLAYLCVSNLHRTANDDPSLREVALGGPDTATRIKTLWQVRLMPFELDASSPGSVCDASLDEWDRITESSTAKLRARTDPDAAIENPCLLPPGAGYTGLENQLYRVEIHEVDESTGTSFFKWSRENGSVVTTIELIDGLEVTVRDLGRDDNLGFATGHWVEILDDSRVLNRLPGVMAEIDVDPDRHVIKVPSGTDLSGISTDRNAQVRRWDSDGPLAVQYDEWLELEKGVEVWFSSGTHKVGDYWLIPARTATGDVEWPRDSFGEPAPQRPTGISTSYCRLAVVSWMKGTAGVDIDDCRKRFDPLVSGTPSTANEALVITGVGLSPDDPISMPHGDMLNDTKLRVREFFNSTLVVGVSRPVDEKTVNRVTCSLTLEIPQVEGLRQIRPILADSPVDQVIGYTQLTLDGNIRLRDDTQVLWKSASITGGYRIYDWVQRILENFQGVEGRGPSELPKLLARFKLQGNFINSSESSRLHLDGKVYGEHVDNRFRLSLPSGQGFIDNFFETWFWLIPDSPQIGIEPQQIDFGTQSGERAVTVSNIGTAMLRISNVRKTGAGSAQFGYTGLPENVEIEPNRNRSFTVSFERGTSDETTTTVEASLHVDSNDPNRPTAVVKLSGENDVLI